MKPEPKTDEVEEIVEQLFQYYNDIDCAETVDQRITAKEQAEFWLKRTLQTQAEKAEREREKLIQEILDMAPGFHNATTDELSFDVGVSEYIARIKAIAIAHGINPDSL